MMMNTTGSGFCRYHHPLCWVGILIICPVTVWTDDTTCDQCVLWIHFPSFVSPSSDVSVESSSPRPLELLLVWDHWRRDRECVEMGGWYYSGRRVGLLLLQKLLTFSWKYVTLNHLNHFSKQGGGGGVKDLDTVWLKSGDFFFFCPNCDCPLQTVLHTQLRQTPSHRCKLTDWPVDFNTW